MSHAIVIGASIGGLGAACVLAKHFDKVTLLDRDQLKSTGPRGGVPQGKHLHVLLNPGYQFIYDYLPKVLDELQQAGAKTYDLSGDMIWHLEGGWKARVDSGLTSIGASRPFLEAKIREHVARFPNVTILEQHNVIEPIFDQGQVTGVLFEDAARKQGTLQGDLIIDATGKLSQSPTWLSKWGYGSVQKSIVRPDIVYSTFEFEKKPEDFNGTLAAAVAAGSAPEHKRLGAIMSVEGPRWIVTLGGKLGDYPPTTLDAFREYAKSLPSSIVFDLIKERSPISENALYKFAEYQWKHYEKLKKFPKGYLIFGDAYCYINPIYGQGMALALASARTLDICLQQGKENLASRFYAKAVRLINDAWAMAIGGDYVYPEVEGKRPFGFYLLNRYMAKVQDAATSDPVVSKRFYQVLNFSKSPTSLLAPGIFWRVIQAKKSESDQIPQK